MICYNQRRRLLRVFQNVVLRRKFGPKRKEVKGDWRKLHSEMVHELYTSPSIVRMIKSSRMRWAGYVARTGKMSRPSKASQYRDKVTVFWL
jgi:hypothetical protein